MTSLDAIVANSSSTPTPSTTSSGSTSSTGDQFGQDTFLKLLVAQLKYQDPQSPADPTQFLSQTAQFTMVEKLADLATQNTQLLTAVNSQVSASQAQEAASLVGRTVTYTDAKGASQTGVVTAANLASPPTLTIGKDAVALSAVTAVTAAGTGSGAGSTPGSGTGSPPGSGAGSTPGSGSSGT